jgi:hypothetical protein
MGVGGVFGLVSYQLLEMSHAEGFWETSHDTQSLRLQLVVRVGEPGDHNDGDHVFFRPDSNNRFQAPSYIQWNTEIYPPQFSPKKCAL